MKSLEIVNEILDMDCDTMFAYQRHWHVSEKYLETIKQDLEVLEIIKKKKVDMAFFIIVIHSTLHIDEQINYYNLRQCNYCKLINEEFIKLKQWLEENE